MESPDPHLDPKLIAEALADMHKHLALLREQFASLYPKEELVSKPGKYDKGWLVDALAFNLKTLERALGIPQDEQPSSDPVR